jgi:alpha-glucosidase
MGTPEYPRIVGRWLVPGPTSTTGLDSVSAASHYWGMNVEGQAVGPSPTGTAGGAGGADRWWQTGLLYQVYVRSFADTDGDGVGDLRGVLGKLDYLSWLGVDGIWLSPVTVSPDADWGYDVSNYQDVQPVYGTLHDLEELIDAAAGRGIRVLLDLVPNHTSDRHPWFVESRSSRDSARRDWYVWADPGPDGALPNNWVSCFGGPAWTLDDATGQFYLHNFLPEQPDLNWWCQGVRNAFDDILRFWWDRGVAGFRIDVCHMIVKDALLRDNPPATASDPLGVQLLGQRPIWTSNLPEVHVVLRGWRELANDYEPPRLLLGETSVDELEPLAEFYGNGDDELQLGFNFPFLETAFVAEDLRDIVERTEALLPTPAWPVWTGSNHDVSRLATRWAGGDPAKARLALLMLLTLRGTPVLYQGDEIGLQDAPITEQQLLDPVGLRFWPAYKGRDPERTPMPWDDTPNGGFTSGSTTPWLPVSDPATCNVADQREDPRSMLNFVRDLIALRRSTPDLAAGDYASCPSPEGTWVWRRGAHTTVALNFSDSSIRVPVALQDARIAISTRPDRDVVSLDGTIDLGPWEGVVVIEEGPT